jgi:hypothetical protein
MAGPNQPKTGGRASGVPNKATSQAREAIALFVDNNAHKLQQWLDEIANGVKGPDGEYVVIPDPLKAFQAFQSVIEYHVPKLQRTDMAVSGDVTVKTFNVKRVKPSAD